MSRLETGGQKPESYNETLGVIKAKCRKDGNEIAKECKRRGIRHFYHPNMKEIVDGYPTIFHMIRIEEKGLKVQELLDWVMVKFDAEERLSPYDFFMRPFGEGLVMTDKHKPEWYDENLAVIYARYKQDGDEIAKECKRRGIRHIYHPNKIEIVGGWPTTFHTIRIEEKGLKVQQLAGWAIMKFNTEERLKTEDGMNVKNVWVQHQEEK